MDPHKSLLSNLESQIASLESQLSSLRYSLAVAKRDASAPSFVPTDLPDLPDLVKSRSHASDSYLASAMDGGFSESYQDEIMSALALPLSEPPNQWPLSHDEYKRYGRQLIMPEIGMEGQLKLKNTRVLIVGVGGLGCPAVAYLAGAGVGTLGLVDGDEVEESNLHRQILHSSATVGQTKVESALQSLKELNPLVNLIPFKTKLYPENAAEIIGGFDVVLDCTDTPASRYLISDACILTGKPLVSASALRTEGQLMVLNYPPRPPGSSDGGPCYRCIFPKSPPADSVISCSEGGILGPVVGVMGVLQALETLKIISISSLAYGMPSFSDVSTTTPTLLIFSAYSNPQFRNVKLRQRSPKCAACSSQSVITHNALTSGSMDYAHFCGIARSINILTPEERVSAMQYAEARKHISLNSRQHRIIDVREKVQFDLCHLFGSINIPFSRLTSLPEGEMSHDSIELVEELRMQLGQARQPIWQGEPGDVDAMLGTMGGTDPILVVCRLGNDSQVAVRKLKELGLDDGGATWLGDIEGGLRAWREQVDGSFPDY